MAKSETEATEMIADMERRMRDATYDGMTHTSYVRAAVRIMFVVTAHYAAKKN